jgi:hypothetical protein
MKRRPLLTESKSHSNAAASPRAACDGLLGLSVTKERTIVYSSNMPETHAAASQLTEAEADLIRNIERERLRALSAGDIEAAHRLHADEFQLITSGGSPLTKEQYLDLIASRRLEYLVCEVGPIVVRMYGAAAVIRYESYLDVRIGGTPDSGRFWHTDVYEKRDGHWQAVWSQATRQDEARSPETAE